MAELCSHRAIERARLETLRLGLGLRRGLSGRGLAGGKADDQGKFWTVARRPDTESAERVA